MFQRPYVWGEERNWIPLWEDIAAAADSVVDDMESGEWPDEPPTYFLGSIVVKGTPNHPQRLAGSILVDGQQRLTTLQIMLAAARSVAADLGADSAAGRFEEWVENSAKAVHEKWPDDKFKLWPLPQDREPYLWAVRPPEDQAACPDSDHRISQARVWFENAIRAWATRDGMPGDRLDSLHSALESRIALVRINLEKTDNAQVIFEALNHRGVELSQSDLVKNLLFRLVEDQGERHLAEKLLVDHWLPLDGRSWRAETVTGRIRRSLLDQVIAYWLTLRKAEVVPVERLFDDFKSWLLGSNLSAAEVIQDIRKYADLYLQLATNAAEESTAALVDLVLATKTTTAWPLILAVHGDERIPDGQRKKTIDAVYSYLARRMLSGLTAKDYNRIFVSVLQDATASAAAGGFVGDAVEGALARLAGDSRNWPDDGEFSVAISGSNFYTLNQSRQRVFFAGIENFLRDDRAEDASRIRAQWGHMNIEHVMPQKWRDHWPVDETDEEAVLRRERALNMVGNLTLTNGRLNSQMRNRSWPEKKPELQQKSTMLITTASILSAPSGSGSSQVGDWADEWEETRIRERTAYLARLALQVWPRPGLYPVGEGDDDEVDVTAEDSDEGAS